MDPTLKALLLVIAGGVVISLFGGTFAFIYGRIGHKRDVKSEAERRILQTAKDDVEKEKEKVRELQREVKQLQSAAEARDKAAIPIEAAMQAMLIAKLTNDHTPQADALLKKAAEGTLTTEDAIKFAQAMKERETDTDPRIGEAQQLAAKILPDMIRLRELAEIEKESGCEVKTLMVTVPETTTVRAQDGGTQEEEKDN